MQTYPFNESLYLIIENDTKLISDEGIAILIQKGIYHNSPIDIYGKGENEVYVFDFDSTGYDYVEFMINESYLRPFPKDKIQNEIFLKSLESDTSLKFHKENDGVKIIPHIQQPLITPKE